MNDDWSLKGKTVVKREYYQMQDGDHIHEMDEGIDYILKSDIEILRWKLIEDMKEYFAGWSTDTAMATVIINKRFGVEDDKD